MYAAAFLLTCWRGQAFLLECTNGNTHGMWASIHGLPAIRKTEGNCERELECSESLKRSVFLLPGLFSFFWYSEKPNFVVPYTVSAVVCTIDSMLPPTLERRPELNLWNHLSHRSAWAQGFWTVSIIWLQISDVLVFPTIQKIWQRQNPVVWHLLATVREEFSASQFPRIYSYIPWDSLMWKNSIWTRICNGFLERSSADIQPTHTGLAGAILMLLKFFHTEWKRMVSPSLPMASQCPIHVGFLIKVFPWSNNSRINCGHGRGLQHPVITLQWSASWLVSCHDNY